MKLLKNILLIILSVLFLYSCKYEIDYSQELPEEKLMLSSFIEADSLISFNLFKSAVPGTYNNGEEIKKNQKAIEHSFVRDANVDLIINGSTIETLNGASFSNQYKFNAIPKSNDKVEIKINHKDFKQAIGRADLSLDKPIVDSSHFSVQSVVDDYGYKRYRAIVYLEIRDDGKKDNYYKIEHELFYRDELSPDTIATPLSISCELLWENIAGVYQETSSMYSESKNRYGVINNKLFKGGVYKVKLSISLNDIFISESSDVKKTISGSIKLAMVEKQAYDYLFTLNRYFNNNFMSEPVIILDAIENGYGFVSGRNTLKVRNINVSFY